jgi:hypothetical protein
VRLKARMFDSAGQPIGDVVTVRQYWHQAAADQKTDPNEN